MNTFSATCVPWFQSNCTINPSKRPNTLTARNVRLSKILTSSCNVGLFYLSIRLTSNFANSATTLSVLLLHRDAMRLAVSRSSVVTSRFVVALWRRQIDERSLWSPRNAFGETRYNLMRHHTASSSLESRRVAGRSSLDNDFYHSESTPSSSDICISIGAITQHAALVYYGYWTNYLSWRPTSGEQLA